MPLSLSCCDVILSFHVYPEAPLLLLIVVFFPFTLSDVPSIPIVMHSLDLIIKLLLSYHQGISFLFSSIKYFSKVEGNEQKVD